MKPTLARLIGSLMALGLLVSCASQSKTEPQRMMAGATTTQIITCYEKGNRQIAQLVTKDWESMDVRFLDDRNSPFITLPYGGGGDVQRFSSPSPNGLVEISTRWRGIAFREIPPYDSYQLSQVKFAIGTRKLGEVDSCNSVINR